MTIFVFYVNPQTPNIENFDVYGGLWALGGISSVFSRNFPSNAVRIMSGDPFLTRVMTFSTFFSFLLTFLGSTLVLFGLIWSYLVLFGLISFISSYLVLFGLIWS